MHDDERMDEIRMGKLRNANTMLVQFNSYKQRVAGGKVQTLYYKHPFEFRSLDQLLMIIEDVLDSVGFVKDQGDFHSLYEKRPPVFQYFDPGDIYTDEDINNKNYANAFSGELSIRVLHRQNNSMQGEIKAGGRSAYFRSSLELLRMLYEFVEQRYREI